MNMKHKLIYHYLHTQKEDWKTSRVSHITSKMTARLESIFEVYSLKNVLQSCRLLKGTVWHILKSVTLLENSIAYQQKPMLHSDSEIFLIIV